MNPSKDDVRLMVVALFTLISGVERARRQKKAAAALDLLQVIAASEGIRPSDIAGQRLVHRSLVTRQLRDLEDAGYVQFAADPRDGRSWLVALTPAGRDEMLLLQEVGLERFAMFVAGWQPGEVRQLTALLEKLASSMAAVTDQESQAARSEPRPRSRASRHAREGQR
jgi:DNA-binding MarR family transcriptional regulator